MSKSFHKQVIFTGALVMSFAFVTGCTLFPARQNVKVPVNATNDTPPKDIVDDDKDSMVKDGVTDQDEMKQNDGAMMEKIEGDEMMKDATSYSGAVLAGSVSPVLDFNKADFDAAVAGGKNVVLYFYASWCPTCKAEIPKMYSAFNQLSDQNLVAFRVNFNDTDTDNDEKNLARTHGVPYQHTKVFLKGGTERVLKSPETWDTQRYLSEIAKAFN